MKFIVCNDTSRIPRLTEQISAHLNAAKVDPAVIMRLNLCLDELLTNTIHYGYKSGGHHEIAVNVAVRDDTLRVELVDNAAAFDPTQDAPTPDLHSSLEHRQIGGLGIYLVKTFVDAMEYHRTAEGYNKLLLIKHL